MGLSPKDYFAIAFSDDEILSKDIVVSCAQVSEAYVISYQLVVAAGTVERLLCFNLSILHFKPR